MTTESNKYRGRIAFLLYGLTAYLLFLVTFMYVIGFIENLIVPKSIDSGTVGPIMPPILINALLLSLFAVQHTIMARPGFKKRWTQIVPEPIERATFVVATCIVLGLLFWFWRALPAQVWSVETAAVRVVLHGLAALGWVTVLYATFCIDHFDLFGLRQVVLYFRKTEYTSPEFATPWLYQLVRNPLMLGFLTAFWSTPDMSQGRLLFALLTTGYVFVGITFEERDLLRALGEGYRRYRERTPMILPWPRPSPVSHKPESQTEA